MPRKPIIPPLPEGKRDVKKLLAAVMEVKPEKTEKPKPKK